MTSGSVSIKTPGHMELSVEVENQSSIVRKLTVKVPAQVVKNHFEKGLIAIQKTAKIKGFRPGQVPISIVKQYYGEDVRHRVFHNLIDESFEKAVQEKNLRAIGSPKIDTPEHKTGAGEHDHTLKEDQDLTYTATFEVMPELEVKNYTGISVTRDQVEVTGEQVDKVVDNLHQSHGQLVPVGGGLALADGTESSRPAQKGDFADIAFSGAVMTESGFQPRDDMKGNQLVELGNSQLIPGFDDQILGMRRGETKTFKIQFPKDYSEASLAEKDAEFTVTLNELKEKKLPALDDELAKQMGYENLADLRKKAEEFLSREKTEESERKVRSDLLSKILEKNPFDVPLTLVEGQTRALAQDWAQELKKQGYDQGTIQNVITSEIASLKTRAESQVRASLVLEAIAKKEEIAISDDEFKSELERLSTTMKVSPETVQDYYAKNPNNKEDLMFRLRQERTLKFLIDKSKVKTA